MSRLDPLSRESLAPSLTDAAVAEARVAFRERGVAQIDDFLAAESAAALHGFLEQNTGWQHVVTFGEDAYDLDLAEASAHERARHELLVAAAQRRARDGFQFAYQNVRVSNDPAERRTRDWPIDRLLDALNSPATLALFRTVLDEPGISRLDGRATCYRPGDFLASHDDGKEDRHTAYVLGLSPKWRVDWGGLLLLHDPERAVSEALHPVFNSLTLFRVPRQHSVSAVAPFAPVPRYAFTGWCLAESRN